MVADRLQRVVYKGRKTKDLWHGLLRTYASGLGLVPRRTDYTRFIILGRSRVGSNLLRSLLNGHRRIVTFGEVFRHAESIGWDFAYYPQSKRMLRQSQADPIDFLETQVYGNFPQHIAAAGFKIFYYHAQEGAWASIWDYLRNDRAIKVVHLKRHNVLRTYVSREQALATNVWTSKRRVPAAAHAPLRLSYEACLREFETTRQWEQEYDALFADHPKIDVCYETLSKHLSAEMQRIQTFLGVECVPVRAETRKQSTRRLADSIENYDQLKEQFADTPWRDFFED